MIEKKRAPRRKFAHEILALAGLSALAALILFLVLTNIAVTVAEVYCFEHDVPMTEFDWIAMDRWIFGVGGVLSVSVFCLLFLSLLAEKLAYIRRITQAIGSMLESESPAPIAPVGNNELTELADAINHMSQARLQLRQREQALAREKDQLVRTLSHDIRTPLTAILAYGEFLAEADDISAEDRKAHLRMIRKKGEQIRELTDILLDGGKRNLEYFSNARLLMEQLAAEFEETLEGTFPVTVDLSGCPAFAGTFDVQELRRIFDNLGSNVQKYAQADQPVYLTVRLDGSLVITQRNAVNAAADREEGHGLGINSIRRIAQHYGGGVSLRQEPQMFQITVTLADF